MDCTNECEENRSKRQKISSVISISDLDESDYVAPSIILNDVYGNKYSCDSNDTSDVISNNTTNVISNNTVDTISNDITDVISNYITSKSSLKQSISYDNSLNMLDVYSMSEIDLAQAKKFSNDFMSIIRTSGIQ